MVEKTYTQAQVVHALNRAADDILHAVQTGETGLRDTVNLVVNVAVHYLRHHDHGLGHAIRSSYQDEPATVLGWLDD